MHTTPRKKWKKQGAGADPHVLSFLGFVEFPLSSRAKRAVFSIFLTLSQVSSVSRAGRAESSPEPLEPTSAPFRFSQAGRAESNSGASGACRHPCGNAELYTYLFFVCFLFAFIILVETTKITRYAHFPHIQTVPSVLRTA